MNTVEQVQTQIRPLERVIEDKQAEIVEKQSQIDSFEYECTDDDFCDWIDSIYSEVNIGSLTFSPSDIMKQLDPVAYRCSKADYESNYDLDDIEEYNDLKDELETLEDQLSDLENDLDELNDELESLENDEDSIYSKSGSRLNGLYWAETENGNMLSFKTQDELYAFLNNQ